jgi:twitching motility protein PilT
MAVASSQALATARLLQVLSERRGSDLHLVPGSYPTVRVDGSLQALVDEPVVTAEAVAAAADFLLTPSQQALLEQQRQAVAVYSWEGRGRFRVEAQYELDQLSMSVRQIPSSAADLAQLQAPAAVQSLVSLQHGLIIVSGPTGSGRTAVAAALVHGINATRQVRIVTIEQPVEYLFAADKSLVEQREVGRDVPSVPAGLQQAQRGDANVIMVSPVSTAEDWQAVLETVEAGKLVVAVAAGESSAGTLEHIHASFGSSEQAWARNLLSESLAAVISLRLVPKVGGGQAMVFEVVTLTAAVQSALREGRFWQLPSIIQTSRQEGMQSLEFALAQLVKAGNVKQEDAVAQVPDQRALLAQLR